MDTRKNLLLKGMPLLLCLLSASVFHAAGDGEEKKLTTEEFLAKYNHKVIDNNDTERERLPGYTADRPPDGHAAIVPRTTTTTTGQLTTAASTAASAAKKQTRTLFTYLFGLNRREAWRKQLDQSFDSIPTIAFNYTVNTWLFPIILPVLWKIIVWPTKKIYKLSGAKSVVDPAILNIQIRLGEAEEDHYINQSIGTSRERGPVIICRNETIKARQKSSKDETMPTVFTPLVLKKIQKIFDVLSGGTLSVLLCGPAGAGKSWILKAIVELLNGERQVPGLVIPENLKGAHILRVDPRFLIEGIAFTGEATQRITALVEYAQELYRSTGRMPIICIDEIHQIFALQGSKGHAYLAEDLKKHLEKEAKAGGIKVLGLTTLPEYQLYITGKEVDFAAMKAHYEKTGDIIEEIIYKEEGTRDQKMEARHPIDSRFVKVLLGESTVDNTTAIAQKSADYFLKEYHVVVPDDVIGEAIRLKGTNPRYVIDGALMNAASMVKNGLHTLKELYERQDRELATLAREEGFDLPKALEESLETPDGNAQFLYAIRERPFLDAVKRNSSLHDLSVRIEQKWKELLTTEGYACANESQIYFAKKPLPVSLEATIKDKFKKGIGPTAENFKKPASQGGIIRIINNFSQLATTKKSDQLLSIHKDQVPYYERAAAAQGNALIPVNASLLSLLPKKYANEVKHVTQMLRARASHPEEYPFRLEPFHIPRNPTVSKSKKALPVSEGSPAPVLNNLGSTYEPPMEENNGIYEMRNLYKKNEELHLRNEQLQIQINQSQAQEIANLKAQLSSQDKIASIPKVLVE